MKAQLPAGAEACRAASGPTLLETPRPQGKLARAQLANMREETVPVTAYTKDQRSQFKPMPTSSSHLSQENSFICRF